MTKRLEQLFRGMLELEIIGSEPERFLNLVLSRELEISGVRWDGQGRLFLWLSLPDVYRLRELCRLSHCRFKIRHRVGLPFVLAFLRRRPVLPIAVLLCLPLLCWLSSLVLYLEVESPYPLTAQQEQYLLQLAAEAGVCPHASRWGMDLEQAEEYLRAQEPTLIFAEIEEHGSRLVISVVYRIDVTDPDQQKLPGDVIATADGVIRQILVQRGRPLVQPGSVVRQGDVLISGQVGTLQVAASGMIVADIWTEGYGECATYFSGIKETGNKAIGIGLRLGDGPVLTVFGSDSSPYGLFATTKQVKPLCLWRKMLLPVEVLITCYQEQMEYSVELSREQAQNRAKAAAMAVAYTLLPEQAAVTQMRSQELASEDTLLRVHMQMQAEYDLGQYRQGIDPVAAEQAAAAEKAAQE